MVFTKYLSTIIISSCTTICALLLFAIWHQWVIIRWPQQLPKYQKTVRITKKQTTLWFWHHNRWQHEQVELLWSPDADQAITQLLHALLTVFDEERLLDKKTTLQTVAIDASDVALLSFDRTPFNKQQSVFNKWMMIESILKTLRENNVTVQGVYFLTHHQPMHDAHLDFSHPWPLSGFL